MTSRGAPLARARVHSQGSLADSRRRRQSQRNGQGDGEEKRAKTVTDFPAGHLSITRYAERRDGVIDRGQLVNTPGNPGGRGDARPPQGPMVIKVPFRWHRGGSPGDRDGASSHFTDRRALSDARVAAQAERTVGVGVRAVEVDPGRGPERAARPGKHSRSESSTCRPTAPTAQPTVRDVRSMIATHSLGNWKRERRRRRRSTLRAEQNEQLPGAER